MYHAQRKGSQRDKGNPQDCQKGNTDDPRWMAQTHPQQHGWLDLHGNKLESLPESIGNLVGLTHLNLSNNHITSVGLPSTLGSLTNLKSLNLGMNRLDTLPLTMVTLKSLQELGLFDNLFTELPEFLKFLQNLIKLNIKRNPLSYVQGVAEGMLKEKLKPEEAAYLVHESSLCRTCHKRYKEQRERLIRGTDRGGGGSNVFQEKGIRTYPGLIVPNSVATVSQDVWRVRKVEHEPIK
uniref:Disease resistance R13L4/SHOC-2-like LRR domain-containing protein n=1 Tax=Monopterus albus TaxID=43700 RepID=A0A3Q3JRQ7_MONAL